MMLEFHLNILTKLIHARSDFETLKKYIEMAL